MFDGVGFPLVDRSYRNDATRQLTHDARAETPGRCRFYRKDSQGFIAVRIVAGSLGAGVSTTRECAFWRAGADRWPVVSESLRVPDRGVNVGP